MNVWFLVFLSDIEMNIFLMYYDVTMLVPHCYKHVFSFSHLIVSFKELG